MSQLWCAARKRRGQICSRVHPARTVVPWGEGPSGLCIRCGGMPTTLGRRSKSETLTASSRLLINFAVGGHFFCEIGSTGAALARHALVFDDFGDEIACVGFLEVGRPEIAADISLAGETIDPSVIGT